MSDKNLSGVYKSIAIPLFGFKRNHGPSKVDGSSDKMFVGRVKLKESLLNLMKKTQGERGTYLIAGYRGAGKTSLINDVIREYNKADSVITVLLNLGNDNNLTPIRLFYSISNLLLEAIVDPSRQNNSFGKNLKLFEKWIYIGVGFALISLFLIALFIVVGNRIPATGEYIPSIFLSLTLIITGVALVLFFWGGVFLLKHWKYIKVTASLKKLIERISYESSSQTTLGSRFTPMNLVIGTKSRPVHAREAEELLVSAICELNKIKVGEDSIEVVFIFDEIDKLTKADESNENESNSENEGETGRINSINNLLGSVKYFITTCKAKFFIVSGRETLDSYYSEKGSANSLYESLFDGVYEVPSLLTDDQIGTSRTQISSLIEYYLCKAIGWRNDDSSVESQNLREYFKYLAKNRRHEAQTTFTENYAPSIPRIRYLVSHLRMLVSYLAFHSWGNPKRLGVLFEGFVLSGESIKRSIKSYDTFGYRHDYTEDWLCININDKRSIALSSEIFSLFQYHLSREVTKTSDKLTVSALSSLHFILKLHPYAFSRDSLHRMSEAINVHRSPELNTIVEDLLNQIFKSFIRRVRNGSFRYRFNYGFEQELRYISHINELESASYNFSLNSMGPVKQMFEDNLRNRKDLDVVSRVKIYMTLGEMCCIEQSYNSSSLNYSLAYNALRPLLSRGCEFDIGMLFCELSLKYGDLEERRKNYNNAAAIYEGARKFVKREIDRGDNFKNMLQRGDSKWDMFKQPIWASKYLSLKRGSSTLSEVLDDGLGEIYSKVDVRRFSREANLKMFLGDLTGASKDFLKVLNTGFERYKITEKDSYLKGNALVGLASMCLIGKSSQLSKDFVDDRGNIDRAAMKKSLAEFVCSPSLRTVFPKLYDKENGFGEARHFYEMDFGHNLSLAGDGFQSTSLHISAVISYLNIIATWTVILDFFSKDDMRTYVYLNLEGRVKEILEGISSAAGKAVRSIVFARQMDSAQFANTYMVKDQPETYDSVNLAGLFKKIINGEGARYLDLSEPIVWHQSVWAHKLASYICWSDLVRKKLLGEGRVDSYPVDLSTFSIRSGVLMRWIIARDELGKLINQGKLIKEEAPKEFDLLDLLDRANGLGKVDLASGGTALSYKSWVKIINNNDLDTGKQRKTIILGAYKVARNLYFALQNVRLISKKNLDLVFPFMSQIYYTQWKLLAIILALSIVRDIHKKKKLCNVKPIRSYAIEIQRKFVELDSKEAPDERVPPTHFDYQHIMMRAKLNLYDAKNIFDSSNRNRMGILQQKYYCHDDYSDPEFKLDWTLAHMFCPSSVYLIKNIDDVHFKISNLIDTYYQEK